MPIYAYECPLSPLLFNKGGFSQDECERRDHVTIVVNPNDVFCNIMVCLIFCRGFPFVLCTKELRAFCCISWKESRCSNPELSGAATVRNAEL